MHGRQLSVGQACSIFACIQICKRNLYTSSTETAQVLYIYFYTLHKSIAKSRGLSISSIFLYLNRCAGNSYTYTYTHSTASARTPPLPPRCQMSRLQFASKLCVRVYVPRRHKSYLQACIRFVRMRMCVCIYIYIYIYIYIDTHTQMCIRVCICT